MPGSGVSVTSRPSTSALPPADTEMVVLEISAGLMTAGGVCVPSAPLTPVPCPALRLAFAFPLESSAAEAVVFSIWLPSALIVRSPVTVTYLVLAAFVPAIVAAVVPLITAIATDPATAACLPPAPAIASVVNVWELGTSSTATLTPRIPVSSSIAALVRALPASLRASMRFCLRISPTLPDLRKFFSSVILQMPSVSVPPTLRAIAFRESVTAVLNPSAFMFSLVGTEMLYSAATSVIFAIRSSMILSLAAMRIPFGPINASLRRCPSWLFSGTSPPVLAGLRKSASIGLTTCTMFVRIASWMTGHASVFR